VENFRWGVHSGSCQRLGCPGVRVMYGGFGGATVHGDVAYSTQICSLLEWEMAYTKKGHRLSRQ